MQPLLVTGAQGFIGRYFVAEWLRQSTRTPVVGVGRSPCLDRVFTHAVHWAGKELAAPLPPFLGRSLTAPEYQYHSLDLLEIQSLAAFLRRIRPSAVVHLAAALSHGGAEEITRVNVSGVVALFEAIRRAEIEPPRVLLGSTGAVIGAPESLPIVEEDAGPPVDLYGATKAAAEQIAAILGRRTGAEVVAARIFNPIGPGQAAPFFFSAVVQQVGMLAAGRMRPPLRFGPLDTTRDFLDVRDVASALVLLLERGAAGGIYNVASGIERPIREVLEAAFEVAGEGGLGFETAIQEEAARGRASGIRRHFASVERLQSLGFTPRFSLRVTLRDSLRYYWEEVAASASA
jgi:GDP-4-dehydro-6-deoxy-D-mannose reductase